MRITKEEWIELGNRFCNLKIDFKKKFYYKQKQVKKTRAFKYYNHYYYEEFCRMASALDEMIQKYYPQNIYDINNIPLTTVFYNLGEQHDIHYFNDVLYDDVKTNIELLINLNEYISFACSILDRCFKRNNNHYSKFLYESEKLKTKMIKVINKYSIVD